MAADAPAHLEPSQLGTKEYWDKLYTTELTNHAADPSDIGTCWFDDSDAEAKVIRLLSDLANPTSSVFSALGTNADPLRRDATSFLDLGCGNGSLLLGLRDDGWAGRMLGVDYSAQSVALAQQVAEQRLREGGNEDDDEDDDDDDEEDEDEKRAKHKPAMVPVAFREWDVVAGSLADALENDATDQPPREWDVVLDKGTFDAISLSDELDAQGRRLNEAYRDRIWRLVRPSGGLFLITSCNWTETELQQWFEGVGAAEGAETGGLQVAARVQYRTFSFGGVKGQTISTICFRRT